MSNFRVQHRCQALNSSPVPYKLQIGTNPRKVLAVEPIPKWVAPLAVESKDRFVKCWPAPRWCSSPREWEGYRNRCCSGDCQNCQGYGFLTVGIVPFRLPSKERRSGQANRASIRCERAAIRIGHLNDRLREIYGNLPTVRPW